MDLPKKPISPESNNVIPLDSGALTRPDPVLEELNVIRLEGRYFCFDKHEAKKHTGIYEYRDGNRGIVIETNPRYGQPSIVAYKVLQAVFRKITKEGKPYPDTVAFSYRELATMIGRDIMGGSASQQLITAIRQLQDTQIELYLFDGKNGKREQFSTRRFPLIISSGIIGDGERNRALIKAAVLTVHPAIMDSMRRGHFAIFNWARLSELEPAPSALYKRLFLHLSNLYQNQYSEDSLKFEKLYEDICAEWLGGLKPEKYKSRIQQQLGPYLAALQQTGLIRSVTIDKTADGTNFKLIFKPGKGFFHDYEHFYRKDGNRLLQFQEAADRAQLKAPYTAVREFYRQTLKASETTLDDMIFPERDITFARQMIDQFGEEPFRDLIKFAVLEAPKTHFQMKTIAAIQIYLPAWQADREMRIQRLAVQREEDTKRQRERLEEEYEQFKRQVAVEYLERCTEVERTEIQLLASERISDEYPSGHQMRNVVFNIAQRTIIHERCKVPNYETWLQTRS